MNDAIALANQSIKFASREAAGAAGGLMEWFLESGNQTRGERIMDWLDFNGSDAGFKLGQIVAICSAIGMMFALPWIAGILLLAAFALCWYFA